MKTATVGIHSGDLLHGKKMDRGHIMQNMGVLTWFKYRLNGDVMRLFHVTMWESLGRVSSPQP